MSGFTITAGVSFSGGFTFTEAPVFTNTQAWFGGGTSTVDRITYATDTDTASVRGPLSVARNSLAAAGNTTDAWFAGGDSGGPDPLSRVDRITFATDTATASVRGPLSAGQYMSAATGNTTDGWFGGGRLGASGSPSAPAYDRLSTVNRITYATDTATASVRGSLSLARQSLAAAGNYT